MNGGHSQVLKAILAVASTKVIMKTREFVAYIHPWKAKSQQNMVRQKYKQLVLYFLQQNDSSGHAKKSIANHFSKQYFNDDKTFC